MPERGRTLPRRKAVAVPDPVDLFDSTYLHFSDQVLTAIRQAAFGIDIGQNSWITAGEYDRFAGWLDAGASHHVLEVADRAGCRVTGVDVNESGVATAMRLAAQSVAADRVTFLVADANGTLPFEDGTFDGLLCIDSMNHFPDRLAVLQDWHRVLGGGGRAVFTDPVVITGPVTNGELALRSSIGEFLFVPPGFNEQFIGHAGFTLVRQTDLTDGAALVSSRWHEARASHRDALIRIEGEERFTGLQQFFETVHSLASERRLSRIAYVIEKPGRPARRPRRSVRVT
jgi:SAM-dependent methyltransferase